MTGCLLVTTTASVLNVISKILKSVLYLCFLCAEMCDICARIENGLNRVCNSLLSAVC